jgi:hypothetical protein
MGRETALAIATRQIIMNSTATLHASRTNPFNAYLRSSWTKGMLVTAFQTEMPNMGNRPRYWNAPR